VKGMSCLLHLFEVVYNGGVKLVLVSEVIFEIVAGCERLQAERAAMPSREPTEELMEVEVAKCGCDKLAVPTVEEWEVAVVHPVVKGNLGKVLTQCGEWWGLLDPSSSGGVGSVFVDKVGFKTVPVSEQFQTEEAVVARLVLAGALVMVGPLTFGGDE
jgi:hypothetical protein